MACGGVQADRAECDQGEMGQEKKPSKGSQQEPQGAWEAGLLGSGLSKLGYILDIFRGA